MAYSDPLDPRNREARLRHYYSNKEQYLERNAKKKLKLKAYVDELKSKPCTDCGKSYPPYVMDFDHLPEFEKLLNVARLHTYSYAKIDAEVAKCELVCSNCHRERTHQRRHMGD